MIPRFGRFASASMEDSVDGQPVQRPEVGDYDSSKFYSDSRDNYDYNGNGERYSERNAISAAEGEEDDDNYGYGIEAVSTEDDIGTHQLAL